MLWLVLACVSWCVRVFVCWCVRVSVCWCVRDDSVGLCASPLGGYVRPFSMLEEVFMHLDSFLEVSVESGKWVTDFAYHKAEITTFYIEAWMCVLLRVCIT